MMIIKLRSVQLSEDTIEDTVFIGEEGFTLQNAGRIVLRTGERQLFGADQVKCTRAHQGLEPDVKVVLEPENWSPA